MPKPPSEKEFRRGRRGWKKENNMEIYVNFLFLLLVACVFLCSFVCFNWDLLFAKHIVHSHILWVSWFVLNVLTICAWLQGKGTALRWTTCGAGNITWLVLRIMMPALVNRQPDSKTHDHEGSPTHPNTHTGKAQNQYAFEYVGLALYGLGIHLFVCNEDWAGDSFQWCCLKKESVLLTTSFLRTWPHDSCAIFSHSNICIGRKREREKAGGKADEHR